jgi:hypothetical protein
MGKKKRIGPHARTPRKDPPAVGSCTSNRTNFCGPHALEKIKVAVGRTRTWQDSAREHGQVLRVGSTDRSLGATGCQIGFALIILILFELQIIWATSLTWCSQI